MKLADANNILYQNLLLLRLPESELAFLKPSGSDGKAVYLHRRHLTDIKFIKHMSIQTIPKRLKPAKKWEYLEMIWYLALVFGMPWLGFSNTAIWDKEWLRYVFWLLVIYAIADLTVNLIKDKSHPKSHHQLLLHTCFGEEIVFARSEEVASLQHIKLWLEECRPIHLHQSQHLDRL